jgi:hypothetical protein
MLKFIRPSFKSGIMVVREVVGGVTYGYTFKPTDRGNDFAFQDAAQVLAKYPSCFVAV